MRKSNDAPRKIYVRGGQGLVLFAGKLYGAPKESAIPVDGEVVCEPGEKGRLTVTFRKKGQKNVVENWAPKKVA